MVIGLVSLSIAYFGDLMLIIVNHWLSLEVLEVAIAFCHLILFCLLKHISWWLLLGLKTYDRLLLLLSFVRHSYWRSAMGLEFSSFRELIIKVFNIFNAIICISGCLLIKISSRSLGLGLFEWRV